MGLSEAFFGKCLAALEGMKMAQQKGLARLVLEMDALQVTQLFNSGVEGTASEAFPCIYSIRDLLRKNTSWQVVQAGWR